MITPSYLITILVSLTGAGVALYIRRSKQSHRPMVCPLRANCEVVTHSEFSHFFGAPVELLGLQYYLIIAAAYTLFTAAPALATATAVLALLLMTTSAFLFSAYLTFIQAFTLKEWCSWCLVSAGLCTTLFFTTLAGTDHAFTPLLASWRPGLLAAHLVGITLGLGSATITDLLFFKFIKDFRISHEESAIMRTLSQVIWFGLAVLLLSGLGLYLPQAARLNQSSKFLLKVIVVAVIIINGAFLNFLIHPRLVRISFGGPHHHTPGELRHIRKIAYALGAISAASWYTAFVLGLLPAVSLPLPALLGLYLGLLTLAIFVSQIAERVVARRGNNINILRGSAAVAAQPGSPR